MRLIAGNVGNTCKPGARAILLDISDLGDITRLLRKGLW
jgi:hypothetical protein